MDAIPPARHDTLGVPGSVWWSRADTLGSTDNAAASTWANLSNSAKNLTASATPPRLRNNNAQNINFNPVVEFTSTTATTAGAQYFTAPSMLGTATWAQGHYAFVGYPTTGALQAYTFWELGLTQSGYSDGRFAVSFPYNSQIYWDSGTCCGSNRSNYTPTKMFNSPSVYFAYMDSTSASMPGPAKQGIRQDGVNKATAANPVAAIGNNQSFQVGLYTGTNTFRGVLAEGMMYLGTQFSASKVAQIETYMAVKYGVTLGNNGSSTYAYLDSTGSTIWAANTGYHNNVVGIGRDDVSGLNQLISRSVNSGDQITIISGTAMPSTASAITPTTGATALGADFSYVLMGDNGQSAGGFTYMSSGSLAGMNRGNRVWRVQVSGSAPANLGICIPDALIPSSFLSGSVQLALSTAANFSTGVSTATMTTTNCVASGVGVTNSVPGRMATFSGTTLSGLGGVGYVAVAAAALDHIEITATSNSGVTCAPTTYTVKACGNAACSSLYTGGLTGTLALTGAGVTATPAGGAPFTIASGSSSTTVSAQVLTVSTATVGATGLSLAPSNTTPVWCGLGTAATSTASCALNVGSAGLLFSVPNHYAGASKTVSIKAVRSSDNAQVCLPAFANVTRAIKATCSYLNPSSGTLPLTVGSVRLNSGNTNTACDATGQTLNLAFDATGATSTTLQYWDVGRVQLSLSYSGSAGTGDAGLAMTGSAQFVAAPMGFSSADNALSCVPAFANVTRSVKATCGYINPSSGGVPLQLGALKLNAGNTQAACDATGQTLSLAFDANGSASTTLQYWDVGRMQLSLSYSGSAGTGDAGLAMTGSAPFVSAPMGFIITDYPSVVTAGSAFTFNVKALAYGSNSYVTPNFGRESPAEGVTLGWMRSNPLGTGAQAGAFTGTVGAFSGGVAAVSNATWSEVGNISPSARLASDSYLGSGLSAAGSPIGVMGNSFCASLNGTCVIPPGVTSALYFGTNYNAFILTEKSGSVPCTVANLGDPGVDQWSACYRIDTSGAGAVTTHIQVKPARLELSSNPACGSFSYAGQAFGVTATAKNAVGEVTQNYAGSVARSVNLTDASANTTGSLSGSIPASAFSAGVATLSAGAATAPVFSFSNKLTAPQTISLRATDTDGVSSSGYDASQTLRSGRLQMSNAFGGDKTSLQIPVQLHYWSGKSWVLNSEDTCTVIPTASVVRAQALNTNNTAATWTNTISSVSLSGGTGVITVGAPSPSGTGTVDLAINLGASSTDLSCLSNHPSSTGAGLPWLRSRQGSCASSFDRDPSARATFGIYTPETKRMVHVRELF
ncbi:MAG: hypothetical protein C4K60_09495 [Ideonella sp. MAG2]|nr:MAG: hypothetical protein C4K60_09495 [Ideonella sp. MAG2]